MNAIYDSLSCIFPSSDYKDSPALYKGVDGETTVVDRVMLCSDTNDKLSIKCIIRHTRRPEVWFACSMTFIFFGTDGYKYSLSCLYFRLVTNSVADMGRKVSVVRLFSKKTSPSLREESVLI